MKYIYAVAELLGFSWHPLAQSYHFGNPKTELLLFCLELGFSNH